MLYDLMFYSDVAAKVRAMYGKRVTTSQFLNLASMKSVPQVASWLKSHPEYSAALVDVDDTNIHRAQLEELLKNALYDHYYRLFGFVDMSDAKIMLYPMRIREMEEIKAFALALNAGTPEDYQYTPPSRFKSKFQINFELLSAAKNYSQMLSAIKRSIYYKVCLRFSPDEGGKIDYTALDTALQSAFYSDIMNQIKRLRNSETSEALLHDFGMQIDLLNITWIYRLRRFGSISPDHIYQYLLPVFYKLPRKFLTNLYAAKTDEEVNELFLSSPYKKTFEKYKFKYIEHYLYQAMYDYNRRLLLSPMPSMVQPIGYMILKSFELKNLIYTIECVRYGLPPEELMEYLVGMGSDVDAKEGRSN